MSLLKTTVSLIAGCVLVGLTPVANAATPGQILSDYSSGIVRIVSSCNSGQFQATGFLIGPQVVLTARHVAYDAGDGTRCRLTVTQEGTGQSTYATSYSSWYTLDPSDAAATDFVMVALNAGLVGYYFQLSTVSPRVGDVVIGLGYPLGEPLSLAQGHVTSIGLLNSVPTLEMSLLQSHGNSGGPLLNASGYVVGLTQRGAQTDTSSVEQGLDLARFLGGDPSRLCTGSFSSFASTVCSAPTSTPTATATASTTAKAFTIQDCWVSTTNTINPAGKLFQTSDALPTIYFVERLAHKLKGSVVSTVSLAQPNGQSWWSAPTTWTWTKSQSLASYVGPVTWGNFSQAPRGLWTFTATLSDGSSCSYAFNLVR